MKRTLLTLALTLMCCAICVGQNPLTFPRESVESTKMYHKGNIYQKDLLFYIDILKTTHPYYADAEHCAELDKQAERLYKECGKITNTLDFRVSIAKLAASLHDGHTQVGYWDTFSNVFPVQLSLDSDDMGVVTVSPEDRRDILGKEVLSINGKRLSDILAMARPLISADNEASFKNTLTKFWGYAEFWSLLGMSDKTISLSFTDGTNADINAVDIYNIKIAKATKSADSRPTAQRGVLFDYTIYEAESICYLQFNKFADRLTNPNFPQFARFDDFIREMMADIEAKNIETLVIDLQYNGGGNSSLGTVLLSWLKPHWETKNIGVDVRISELLYAYYPYYKNFTVGGEPLKMGELYDFFNFDHSSSYTQIDYTAPQDPSKHILNFDAEQIFDGNVVFIQSNNSFSSATLLLTLARDNGIGIIIGEPSGGKPCHYGDVLNDVLPNTNTIVTVSHKYFRRPNIELKDMEHIVPDVHIELNDPDKDLAWEWILENYGK